MTDAQPIAGPALPAQSSTTTAFDRRVCTVQDAALVVISGLFAYAHARRVIADGSYTSVFFAIEQTALVGIYLSRRRTSASSTRPFDWVVATVGSWLALALRPTSAGLGFMTVSGSTVQMLGLTLTTLAFISLGKSFGIVAANRGLKMTGPYGFVRHPIYLSHTFTQTGFLIANFQPVNVGILAVVWTCQLLRIRAEERVLMETADYASYRQRVKWRLIPGLY